VKRSDVCAKASDLLANTFKFGDATASQGYQYTELNYLQTLASGLPPEVLRATGYRVSVFGAETGMVSANFGDTKRVDTTWKLIGGKWKATSMRVAAR
jgi:hypothetical protein